MIYGYIRVSSDKQTFFYIVRVADFDVLFE